MNHQNKKLEDSNTYQNLRHAFCLECETSGIYAIYGERAREEGYEQVGKLFEDSSRNEKEHAKLWLRLMKGGDLPLTMDHLEAAYQREHEAWTKRYIEYAEEARREGYQEIAWLFEAVAGIERHHEARFRKILQKVTEDMVSNKEYNLLWICSDCGYLYYGNCAPSQCKVCGCAHSFLQLKQGSF